MWGAWDTKHKLLLALGLFINFVLPVIVGAGILAYAATLFFRAIFGGLHP